MQRVFVHPAVALAVVTLALGCASSRGDDEVAPTTMQEELPPPGDSTPSEVRGLLETVYFDYDSAVLRSDQRPKLKQNAAAIGQHADWRTVVIEGHCDERGSEEYNLALGERRAGAVKQYLIDNGVTGGRIDTVSFGESRPAEPGHDESAWQQNRRGEFSVVR